MRPGRPSASLDHQTWRPMPIRLYALVTWTTLRRLPLINARVADFLRRFLPEVARRHGARTVELAIVRNHVHMLLELGGKFDVPTLLQGLKGASARVANRDGYMPRARLQWAAGYDARSVGVRDLSRAAAYLRAQNARHPDLVVYPG